MALSAFAQAPQPSGGTDRSVWLSYFGDQPFTKLWAVHLEGSYRRTLDLSQFEQSELRPGITLNESDSQQSLFAYTFFELSRRRMVPLGRRQSPGNRQRIGFSSNRRLPTDCLINEILLPN
jgi:Protein of unknown function (DUF2490)